MAHPTPNSCSANSIGCCNILGGRMFEKQLTLSNEDFLSSLPDDCLLEIIPYFDHEGLDEIALVNQKLHSLTVESRSRAKKKRGKYFHIMTRKNGGFLLHASFPGRISRIAYTDSNGCSKEEQVGNPPSELFNRMLHSSNYKVVAKPISCHFFNRMNYLLKRFDFENIDITSIIIDDSFMDHAENIFRGQEEFADWLLSMQADLTFTETSITETGIVNAEFLLRHKYDYQCANLCIDETRPIEKEAAVVLDREMMSYLVFYDDLQTLHFVVDSSWVIELIKARLRRRTQGKWTITTTKKIEGEDVSLNLESDLEYYQDVDKGPYVIRFKPDDLHEARIKVHGKDDDFTTLTIEFNVPHADSDYEYDDDTESESEESDDDE